ncbi:MAG: protein kinase [Gemmatimonadota bacterium]|nr:MAG: protein kinase [Gemmatimonadota bacterium]
MSQQLERITSALAGHYDIEREIGSGGMATVYLAHDARHDRHVALKVLRPELAATLGSERFLREIRIAAKLTHPHILPVYDSGEANGFLYFVMPFIDGESLRQKLAREGELPVGEAVRLARDVADALAKAHKQGVVHRDIKPDNVLLTEGHALVADFGVAKAVSAAAADQEVTSSGMAVGTPAYMAPEQAAADPNIDHRADIYAVGALVYEMLTGRPPFEGTTSQMVLAAHVTETPTPVTHFRPSVPAPVAAVVMRCLEKKAADRWQSAAELRAQLDAVATPSGPVTPTGVAVSPTGSDEAMLRRSEPARVLGVFATGSVVLLALVYLLMVRLGLPDWVFPVTVAILVVALPVVVLTGRAERRRATWRVERSVATPAEGGVEAFLTWRNTLAGGGLAFMALAGAVGVYMTMRLMGIGPVGTLVAAGVLDKQERIVLAEFDNRTTDSTLGATVTELFRIDLTQSPAVTVMDRGQAGQVLERMQRDRDAPLTAELAVEVAEREGLKAVVTGDVLQVGDGYVVSSRLMAASTGEVLWAGRESASEAAEIIGAVDDLSASLRARIGESLRSIRADAPLDRVTTRSNEALRKYAQADAATNQGDHDRAINLLEEALAVDSTFAMAYRKLAVILRNQERDLARAEQAFTRAYELRDRLTERERYLTEAAYFTYVESDERVANEAYRGLLEKYPTDRIALNNLAVNLGAMGHEEEATELYLRSIELGGAPAVTYTNSIQTLYNLGRADTAAAILDRFQQDYPDHPEVARYRAGFESSRFEYDAAEQHTTALRAAQRGNPMTDYTTNMDLANYALARGRLGEARRLIAEAFTIQSEQEFGYIPGPWEAFALEIEAWASIRYLGDTASAAAALDEVRARSAYDSLPVEQRQHLDLAILNAEVGRAARARALIARYEVEVSDAIRQQAAERAKWHSARGALALAEGRPADAIDEFRLMREVAPQCALCGLVELARAFDSAGMPDSAVVYYERYLTTPTLFRAAQDNVTVWMVMRRLGALYEQFGETERALLYYGRFVDLWRDADPELQPQVREIQERMARLAGEPRVTE